VCGLTAELDGIESPWMNYRPLTSGAAATSQEWLNRREVGDVEDKS
jgi:hypothetical protein